MQTLITWSCIRTQVVGYDIMGPTLDPNTLCFFGSVRVRIRGPFSSLLSSRLIHPCPSPPLLQNLHTSIRGRLDSFSISSSPQLVQKNTKKKEGKKKNPPPNGAIQSIPLLSSLGPQIQPSPSLSSPPSKTHPPHLISSRPQIRGSSLEFQALQPQNLWCFCFFTAFF